MFQGSSKKSLPELLSPCCRPRPCGNLVRIGLEKPLPQDEAPSEKDFQFVPSFLYLVSGIFSGADQG